jgi:hypothetical protein
LGALRGGFAAARAAGGLKAFTGLGVRGIVSGTGRNALAAIKGLGRGFTVAVRHITATVGSRIRAGSGLLGGRSIFGTASRFSDSAANALAEARENLKPLGDYHDVIVHGSPTSAIIDGEEVTAAQLAQRIREGSWNGTDPVRLVSCETGSGPFSQQLADELQVRVLAPVEKFWVSNAGNLVAGIRRPATMVERIPT